MLAGMFSWVHRLFGRPTAEAKASQGGVAVAGDNLAPINTGPVINIGAVPDEVSDERLWARCVAAADSIVRQASSRQLFSDTIVAINLIEVETRSSGTDRTQDPESAKAPLSDERIIELISAGRNIVLSGEGGIGKTTAALQFAKSLLHEQPCHRLPILVDAPAWASTSSGPFDFVASLTDYAAAGINPARLARYAKRGKLTLFIDGWNEIAADALESALQRMRAFVVATPDVNIVLTTRNTSQRPDIAKPVLVGVAGIDWRRQQEYIRARLPLDEANALVDHLSVRHRLRHAARNPLILQGLVSLRAEDQTMANNFMVYHAIVEAYESESARSAALSAAPLHGLQRSYLEALAWRLNNEGGTTLPDSEARSVLADEIEALQSRRQIIGTLEPARLLQELCDHHLLFQEHGLVRFAHQRFQEYFAASRYLSLLDGQAGAALNGELIDPINQPAWEDTLLLIADKLSGAPSPSAARLMLIRAAIAVDLHFACVMAAASAFDRRDGPSTFDELVATANRLADAADTAISEYGLACIIDSALPVFSGRLWGHLEQQDQQHRLHFHRLGSNPISIRQLGPDAPVRLLGWDVERHAEFIHEIAGNPDNWEYLVDRAFNANQDKLRIAAISAIRWEYPASDAALEAWLRAPDSVKLSGDLFGTLEDDLLDADADVHAELRRLHATMPAERRHRLALRFQPILPRPPVEYLAEFLREDKWHGSESVLAMFAESDPETLNSLAIELAFSNPHPPDWVVERVRQFDADIRAGLFERAMREFPDEPRVSYARGVVAECANLEQVSAVLQDYLALYMEFLDRRRDFDDQDRYFNLRSLLLQMDGDRLMTAANQEATGSDQRRQQEIARLVQSRADETHGGHTRTPWVPSIEQTDALIQALSEDVQPGELMCPLADIVSRISPDRYADLIARCCQLELDQWSSYRDAITQWADAGGTGERPMNPQNGILLSQALVRWGSNALPSLTRLVDHPQAEQFVFSTIATILQKPWRSMLPASVTGRFDSMRMARLHREADRVMLQPSQDLQAETDAIASRLVTQLDHALQIFRDPSVQDGDRKRIGSRIAALTLALARIPSPIGASPVLSAIASPAVSDRTAVDAASSLLNQGLRIDQPELIARICAVWDDMAGQRWLDQSRAYEFRNLSHTVLRFPHELLPNPASHYLERWMSSKGGYDLASSLAADGSPAAFSLLLQMLDGSIDDSHRHERIAHDIVSALSPETWRQFAEIVANGAFFGTRSGWWYLDNIAASIQAKIGDLPEARAGIIDACVRNLSRAGVSLGCLLLEEGHASDEEAFRFAARVLNTDDPAFYVNALLEFGRLFSRKQVLAGGAYRVLPVASNRLRGYVFSIAASSGRFSNAAKVLLCGVEAERRESGRPADESRHPDLSSATRLADILAAINPTHRKNYCG